MPERLILSREASLRIERDVQSLSQSVLSAVEAIPGVRTTTYGGQYAGAAWTKTPRRKIEVPDIYSGTEVLVDRSGVAYAVLAIYVEPSWRHIERGEFVYTLSVFTGGASRKSKSAPYVREDVIPGDNLRQYVARAYSACVTDHPLPKNNRGRRGRSRSRV